MFPGFGYVKRYIFKTVLRNNNHMNIFKNNISWKNYEVYK